MLYVGGLVLGLDTGPGPAGKTGLHVGKPGLGGCFFGHRIQTRVPGDGPGAALDQFHAVIIGRIMAGRDHDAAVDPFLFSGKHGKVDLFRAA